MIKNLKTYWFRRAVLVLGFLVLGFSVVAQMVNAPVLVFPEDGHELQTSVRDITFSWTPLFPAQTSTTYEIRVVQVHEGQSALAAMESNPPVWEESNIFGTTYAWPVSAPNLLEGKYAWQVVANFQQQVGELYVERTVSSEVYLFFFPIQEDLSCKPVMSSEEAGYFLELDRQDNLVFSFQNDSIQGLKMNYSLFDGLGKEMPVSLTIKKTTQGYLLPFEQYDFFRNTAEAKKMYFLRAHSPDGRKYEMAFMFKE